jgi:hypothetical protein
VSLLSSDSLVSFRETIDSDGSNRPPPAVVRIVAQNARPAVAGAAEGTEAFVKEHEIELGKELAKTIGENEEERHFLRHFFAPNFRFLINSERPNPDSWIALR